MYNKKILKKKKFFLLYIYFFYVYNLFSIYNIKETLKSDNKTLSYFGIKKKSTIELYIVSIY